LKPRAEVIYFRSESVQTAGAEIRRLGDAAAEVGFDIAGARVEVPPPQDPPSGHRTAYGPLDDPGSEAEG
jgi:hypothetical protein